MRYLLYVLVMGGLLGLTSCQKEVDFANNTGGSGGSSGGSSSGDLLVRAVQKQGNDSTVSIYKYDANKKMINLTSTGKNNGVDASDEQRYYRNASGILVRTVQVNPTLASAGVDSVVHTIKYDAASSRYIYSVGGFSFMGFDVRDSTVLVYDAGGKISKANMYQSNSVLGGGYELSSRSLFTYGSDGGISKVELVTVDPTTGAESTAASFVFTYDIKNNPLVGRFSNAGEALLLSHYDWLSPHNPIKEVITAPASPSSDATFTFVYTYNSAGKPVSGTLTETGQAGSDLRMYYQ